MIVDFDDFCEHDHRLDLIQILKEANPLFKCTLFAVPALGSPSFWESVPDWCELAVHGWAHPDSYEASGWSYTQTQDVLVAGHALGFVNGFKAPGWQISQASYWAIKDMGWWVADHYENDGRRPNGISAHVISTSASSGADPNHWHGHIPNVCGNGIQETFPELLRVVTAASSFEFVSEAVSPWASDAVAA